MAKFVEADLENITIMKCNEVEVGGVHQYFMIRIKDENNFRYMWRDNVTACGCDTTTLNNAVKAHILTLDKK